MNNPAEEAVPEEVEAEEVTVKAPPETPTPGNEPTSSIERKPVDVLTGVRIAVPGERRPVTPAELRQAITALSALACETAGADNDIPDDDIFLCYHISMRSGKGEPFTIKGTRQIHKALDPSGIPSAPADVEVALFQIVSPFKLHLMQSLNGRLPAERGGAYARLPG